MRRFLRDREIKDVQKFHDMIHQPSAVSPMLISSELETRMQFIKEEFKELQDAAIKYDLLKIADALIDLVYVIKGTAIIFGLPWEDLWDEVQQANMHKLPGLTTRNTHDAIKPPDWKPPDLETILRNYGWRSL